MFLLKFDDGKKTGREYKIEAICDNRVYAKESDDHPLSTYNLVFWKSNLEEKNTQEPTLAVMYLQRLLFTCQHDYLKKLIVISSPIYSGTLIIKSIAKAVVKQKQGRPTKITTNK